jgi:hypothetical protein
VHPLFDIPGNRFPGTDELALHAQLSSKDLFALLTLEIEKALKKATALAGRVG